jgi:hypothetical protein
MTPSRSMILMRPDGSFITVVAAWVTDICPLLHSQIPAGVRTGLEGDESWPDRLTTDRYCAVYLSGGRVHIVQHTIGDVRMMLDQCR